MTTETTKKAVRLEDKLSEAQVMLAAAEKTLAVEKAATADELAEAKHKANAAEKERVAKHKTLERTREETTRRLGLTPAAAKKATLAWAGLKPGEEDEAMIRGDTQILDDAVKRLIEHAVSKDAALLAARHEYEATSKVSRAADDVVRNIENRTRSAEWEVRRISGMIRELEEKIRDRDGRKAALAEVPKKQVSKEDQARFVEARRRLTLAANGRERGSWTESWHNGSGKTKLEPPFVWPPKEG